MTPPQNQGNSVPLALCWSLIAASLAALIALGGWMVRDPDRFVQSATTTAISSAVVELPAVANAAARRGPRVAAEAAVREVTVRPAPVRIDATTLDAGTSPERVADPGIGAARVDTAPPVAHDAAAVAAPAATIEATALSESEPSLESVRPAVPDRRQDMTALALASVAALPGSSPGGAPPNVPEPVPAALPSALSGTADDQHSDWVVVPGSGSDIAYETGSAPEAPPSSEQVPPAQRDALELARIARAMGALSDERALVGRDRRYESQRTEELSVLAGLSLRLRFAPGESEVADGSRPVLDLMFDPLFVYPDAVVTVSVLGSEGGDPAKDRMIAQRRAASVVDYFVARGLVRDRFEILIDLESNVSGAGLPVQGQRVRVKAEPGRS